MSTPRSTSTLINLATVVLIVVALYFGKPVLMPVAFATLLAFLLNPVVSGLCRTGLKQSIAVTFVVMLGFSIFGMIMWGFASQMTALVAELPDYKQNIREKIVDLRSAGSGNSIERIRQTWRELRGEIKKMDKEKADKKQAAQPTRTTAGTVTNATLEPEPVPVVVRGQPSETFWTIPTALGPLANVGATAALVLILVIFMLLRGRELRNRMIVLFGQNRIPLTTRALDEAAERISRYLLMQTIVNSTYGLAVGVALYFMGLPYALMWGFVAALLRFVPYIGPWVGATMPILLSLAVFPGWLYPLLVLGLILVLELISNMFMEPMLYGSTVGVSEVALIVAVAFWTWIWGPMGLALATPLTVCLVVLGKHVPGLSIVPLLMGDEPVMKPPMQFYQRLLAMDAVEAAEIVRAFLTENDVSELYDELLLPALVSSKKDSKSGALSDESMNFIVQTVTKLIAKHSTPKGNSPQDDAAPVLGIPVEDTVDELVIQMLGHILPESIALRSVSSQVLSGELLEDVDAKPPLVICIGAVVSGGNAEMRYLAKRLRAKMPATPVIIGRWGLTNARRKQELATSTGATNIATTLKEAANFLVHFAQLQPVRREERPFAANRTSSQLSSIP